MMSHTLMMPDVLTLEEVAEYLRIPQDIIERQAVRGRIPGRKFDEWLRSYDSRDILLQQAGALADDDNLAELRANIYAARGRPETEEETQL